MRGNSRLSKVRTYLLHDAGIEQILIVLETGFLIPV